MILSAFFSSIVIIFDFQKQAYRRSRSNYSFLLTKSSGFSQRPDRLSLSTGKKIKNMENQNSTSPTELFQFCPRCGSSHFQTVGSRAKKCRNCSFEYYFNAASAASALIFDDRGRLLFTQRAFEPYKGMLDFPGGFAEPMESGEQTIIRELKEELDADVSQVDYFCSYPNQYPFSGLMVYTLDLIFKVRLKSMDHITVHDDVAGFRFIHPNEIQLDELYSYSMKETLKKLLNE